MWAARESGKPLSEGRDMPRNRNIGLTDRQKDKILHIDRLPPDVRKNLAYDVRIILEKELEDLEFLFSEAPDSFNRCRDHEYRHPFEAIMPSDPKRTRATIKKLEGWISSIEKVRDAIGFMGLRFLRTGRV